MLFSKDATVLGCSVEMLTLYFHRGSLAAHRKGVAKEDLAGELLSNDEGSKAFTRRRDAEDSPDHSEAPKASVHP